jgi:hypothetical protein
MTSTKKKRQVLGSISWMEDDMTITQVNVTKFKAIIQHVVQVNIDRIFNFIDDYVNVSNLTFDDNVDGRDKKNRTKKFKHFKTE